MFFMIKFAAAGSDCEQKLLNNYCVCCDNKGLLCTF